MVSTERANGGIPCGHRDEANVVKLLVSSDSAGESRPALRQAQRFESLMRYHLRQFVLGSARVK
jgi:hypothetical protein